MSDPVGDRVRKVADYIQEHREHVIDRFVTGVRSLDVAQGLSDNEVIDTLPEYLDALIAKSRGEPHDPEAVKQRLEATHISLRLRAGYQQDQVVWEYTLLNRILAALWDEKPEAELPAADDVQALFDALQAAMDHVAKVFGDFSMEDHQLERRTLRRLEAVTATLFAGDRPPPLAAKLPAFLEILADVQHADAAAIWMFDAAQQRLVPAAGMGRLSDPGIAPVPLDGPGFLARVAASEQGLVLADASRAWVPADDPLRHSGLRSVFGARLSSAGKLVGVMVLGKASVEPFPPRERRLLGVLVERLTTIIDRTRSGEQTRSSHDLLRNLLDASIEGFYGIDANGLCTYLNASAARLLGVTDPATLLGRDMHALTHHSKSDGSPYPASECPIRNVLHSGTPEYLETVLWRPDGSSFTAALHAAPIIDDHGVSGAVVGFSDVSARKRQEELVQRLGSWANTLDESLASLTRAGAVSGSRLHGAIVLNRAVLENALDAVVGMDADGAVIDWNAQAEQMFGWTRQEALGRSLSELIIPPHQRAAHDAGLARYLATATGPILNRRVELTALRRDRREFPVELTVSPLSSSRTHVFYAFLRDLTARKQLETERATAMQDLERTLQLNESFMGVLAHDLRSPLSAVATAATLMRAQPQGLDLPRLGEIVESSAARMARMVEQLLDVSRARVGGGIPINRKHIDLQEVCGEVVRETRVTHPQRTIEFETSGDCAGEWDSDRMAQVISNLLGNAVQHGEPEAAVRVEIDGEEEHAVVLRVSNRGAIPPQRASTLFQPFSGGKPDSGNPRGLGLGLYITHEIVSGHGGAIDMQSSERSGSTRVVVRLPRHGTDRLRSAEVLQASPAPPEPTR